MGADTRSRDAELALSGDDGLPWLESGEDDYEEGAVDTRRIVTFAAILLVLLVVAIGALWWFTSRGTGSEIVADGSTIEAPDTPYKVRPDDPGGKEFAGTGNIAPAVGEGESREGRLAPADPPASAPVETPTETPAGPSLSVRTTQDKPVAQDGVGVQVGAYRSRAMAEAGWVTLRGQTTRLNGVRHRVVKGQADIGTVYRLQAVAPDLASARALCRSLKDDGLACQVKR